MKKFLEKTKRVLANLGRSVINLFLEVLQPFLTGMLIGASVVAIFVVFLGYAIGVEALVVYKFWEWFLIPIFGSVVPQISYVASLGVAMFLILFKSHDPLIKRNKFEDLDTNVKIAIFLKPWVVLGIGYLVKFVMDVL
ncbi:MAG: hypothetical protein ACOC1O_00660 [bacterium]